MDHLLHLMREAHAVSSVSTMIGLNKLQLYFVATNLRFRFHHLHCAQLTLLSRSRTNLYQHNYLIVASILTFFCVHQAKAIFTFGIFLFQIQTKALGRLAPRKNLVCLVSKKVC